MAYAVLNRQKRGRWGDTIKAVVTSPGQFEPWMMRRTAIEGLLPDDPLYKRAAVIADAVLIWRLRTKLTERLSIPPAGRRAAETAAEKATSMGEEISDVASDVSDMAYKQYSRAQDMAVEAFDDVRAAMKRNPLMAVAIALGLGFLFGVLTRMRR